MFLVSYPSSKQQRTVDPEPANSARFRSAKPSCSQENNGGEGERTKIIKKNNEKKNYSIKGYAVSHRPKEDSASVSEGRNRSQYTHGRGCEDPLLLRMGRVTFLVPSQVDAQRPSGSQAHVEEGRTVVVVARTVLISPQPLHNQGHGRH